MRMDLLSFLKIVTMAATMVVTVASAVEELAKEAADL